MTDIPDPALRKLDHIWQHLMDVGDQYEAYGDTPDEAALSNYQDAYLIVAECHKQRTREIVSRFRPRLEKAVSQMRAAIQTFSEVNVDAEKALGETPHELEYANGLVEYPDLVVDYIEDGHSDSEIVDMLIKGKE